VPQGKPFLVLLPTVIFVTVPSLAGNYLYASYLAVTIGAAVLVLLPLTAKHYGTVLFGKPARPTPPPSAPIAVAYTVPRNGKGL